MVEVSVEGDQAVFAVQGWDKLWALRSRLEIPLAHIKGAHTDPSPKMGWFQGLKVLGASIPNVFRAGTFYQDGGWVFWDVRDPDKAIVVELRDEQFQQLVIEVCDPTATVSLLNRSVGDRGAEPLAAPDPAGM
jgi:hypothetical protein